MLTQQENRLLTETGPQTPMGGLLRRFWLPALLSSELPRPDSPPVRLTLLSEDLIAFRDSEGRVGVLDRYCPHRGASLFWGRNEECGLRCVYHGWKFDVQGHCMDMPNEPAEHRFRDKVQTVAYPTEERGGVVWVYMGPKGTSAVFPELEWTRVPASHRIVSKRIQECNYLQNVEGEVDSAHVSFLHSMVGSGGVTPGTGAVGGNFTFDRSPHFSIKTTDYGLMITARRNASEGGFYWRITPYMMPTYTIVPNDPGAPQTFTAAVPIDDTHMYGFSATWHPDRALTAEELKRNELGLGAHVRLLPGGFDTLANKANDYLIDRDSQRTKTFTGIYGVREQDMAVQSDQWGPVTRRWKEHLGTTDLAVIAMRRRLLRAVKNLQQGIAPPEASNGDAYRVRSVAIVLGQDVEVEEGVREVMRARA
ncbi:MAG TPA: Rieske 2Fe-2S domain-containing protein [Dehalococcoidia bacterium]|nr:Rieske 2Fe-2S domain-containing protein [Dehalococcoidia bacterium]